MLFFRAFPSPMRFRPYSHGSLSSLLLAMLRRCLALPIGSMVLPSSPSSPSWSWSRGLPLSSQFSPRGSMYVHVLHASRWIPPNRTYYFVPQPQVTVRRQLSSPSFVSSRWSLVERVCSFILREFRFVCLALLHFHSLMGHSVGMFFNISFVLSCTRTRGACFRQH